VLRPRPQCRPLIVILFVTAVKDAIEDWRRTVLDNELNNSPVHRDLSTGTMSTPQRMTSRCGGGWKVFITGILWLFKKWQDLEATETGERQRLRRTCAWRASSIDRRDRQYPHLHTRHELRFIQLIARWRMMRSKWHRSHLQSWERSAALKIPL
jgi:hypothetical protein